MNVTIVGASGYSGLELIRLIIPHPKLNITHLFVNQLDNESIADIFPQLNRFIHLPLESIANLTEERIGELRRDCDLVFLATPSGVSKVLGPKFLKDGFKVIDLSGDFRLKNPEVYKQWYGLEPATPELLQNAVYGLPEWFANEIKGSNFIANPGCYATSITLALAPLLHHHYPFKSIIIDAKSGVSGAGKGYSKNTHFSEVNENMKAYKVGAHQHIPEVEQTLGLIGNTELTIQMITHLAPMIRGIISTIYVELAEGLEVEDLHRLYQNSYMNQPFVRIRPLGDFPETKQVYGSNFCDIGMYFDKRTNRVILISVIDNLVKGAAGQAIQNANIMMGWDQTLGLSSIPIFP